LRRLAGAAALAVAVVAAAGCGTGGIQKGGDASQGKQLFSEKCASCHTLADAGATGTVGPNLDAAFRYDRKQGFAESTIKQVVKEQIKIAYPPMPNEAHLFPKCKAGQSSAGGACSEDPGADVADIAAYVSSVAGKSAKGGVTQPATPAQAGKAAQAPPGGGKANVGAQGKQIFTSAGCAGCHTLKDANATGTIGPNLDQLKPPQDVVEKQVTNGGGGMPAFKGQLSPEQIKAVAAYVASVAGKG
jgi:mono/diheme cytochrome c family protein